MRICIVAFSNHLDACLSALNPNLEIAAIIVDSVTSAKSIVEKHNLSEKLLYHYHDLKECLENSIYDYIVMALRFSMFSEIVIKDLYSLNISKTKFINLWDLDRPEHVCSFTLLMSYFKENPDKFKTFITGDSHLVFGVDIDSFSLPTINFARGSQDLYYDYKIAKYAMQFNKGTIKYAIIGLSVYSFNWDVSQSYRESWRLLQYYLFFKDLHNNWLSKEKYGSLFREEFLKNDYILTKTVYLSNVYHERTAVKIGMPEQLRTRKFFDMWNKKDYPLTVEENKSILLNYLMFCNENNIVPILVLPPIMKDCKHLILKKRLDQFYTILNEILSKCPFAKFIDSLILDDLKEEDFFDSNHLNVKGSKKFTKMLDDYIINIDNKNN